MARRVRHLIPNGGRGRPGRSYQSQHRISDGIQRPACPLLLPVDEAVADLAHGHDVLGQLVAEAFVGAVVDMQAVLRPAALAASAVLLQSLPTAKVLRAAADVLRVGHAEWDGDPGHLYARLKGLGPGFSGRCGS